MRSPQRGVGNYHRFRQTVSWIIVAVIFASAIQVLVASCWITETLQLANSQIQSRDVSQNTTAVQPQQNGLFYKFLMSGFDWNADSNWTLDTYEVFFAGVQEFHNQEPLVPINETCYLPPLPVPPSTCSLNSAFASHRPRTTPAKVGHAIQFGFDVDTLEIHLRELYDVVDVFFIVEMTLQHNQRWTKELIWDSVKKQDRFRLFRDKVVHIVLDDVDAAQLDHSVGHMERMWQAEDLQERLRWERIVEWNNRTNFFGPLDVIGFGDTDEIASRQNVHLLKYCRLKTWSLDIGIWFPFGFLDQAFASDFPVQQSYEMKKWNAAARYTLGDPSFFTWGDAFLYAKTRGKAPSRQRGGSGAFLLGGIHMTHYGYLPYQLVKESAAKEADDSLGHLHRLRHRIRLALENHTLLELEE